MRILSVLFVCVLHTAVCSLNKISGNEVTVSLNEETTNTINSPSPSEAENDPNTETLRSEDQTTTPENSYATTLTSLPETIITNTSPSSGSGEVDETTTEDTTRFSENDVESSSLFTVEPSVKTILSNRLSNKSSSIKEYSEKNKDESELRQLSNFHNEKTSPLSSSGEVSTLRDETTTEDTTRFSENDVESSSVFTLEPPVNARLSSSLNNTSSLIKEYSEKNKDEPELSQVSNFHTKKIVSDIIDNVKNTLNDTSFTTTEPSNESASSVNEIDNCRVNKFDITKTNVEKTAITIKFMIDNYDSRKQCFFYLSVDCKSLNKSALGWIVQQQTNETEITTNEAIITVQNLSEYTTYRCTANLTDETSSFNILKSFKATTLPEVPSEIDFHATEIQAKSLTLRWKRPSKIPGTLKNYHVIIENLGPKHYVREECEIEKYTKTFSIYNSNKTIIFSIKEDDDIMNPYNVYTVEVLAEDEAGNSTGVPQNITTASSLSDVPENATNRIIKYSLGCNNDEFNMSLLIQWELPCNTNGELKEFLVETSSQERRKYGTSQTGITYTNKIPITNSSEIFYELYLNNLNASSSYNSKIIPISKDGTRGIPVDVESGLVPEGCPLQPGNITVSNIQPTYFSINWEEPEEYVGEILEYTVDIRSFPPEHFVSDDNNCPTYPQSYQFPTFKTSLEFEDAHPHLNYSIRIRAKTSVGFGKYAYLENVETPNTESDPVRDITLLGNTKYISPNVYKYNVKISFKEPCNMNGPFKSYRITGIGHQDEGGEVDQKYYEIEFAEILMHNFTLNQPEVNYSFTVQVVTKGYDSKIITSPVLRTAAGIPPMNSEGFKFSVSAKNPTQIDVILHRNITNDTNGKVKYYAVILARCLDENVVYPKNSFGFWDGAWISPTQSLHLSKITDVVQLNISNPFQDGSTQFNFSIGKTDGCKTDDSFCKPLLEKTFYIMVIRSLTATTYSDIYTLVHTGSAPDGYSGTTSILTMILLLIIIGIIVIFLMRERKLWIFSSLSQEGVIENLPKYLIPVKHFPSYYNKILNDPTLLKKQYDDIDDEIQLYKHNFVNTTYATKPENKRKNRYTNILPYDEFRVKLKIEEDDEMSSDYINASYIKGYSGNVEYIATQGPLEHTCKDFWKMVIQENVTVIVMVSQFIEKEKEKCFKYFPNNHETMLIYEDVEVKCVTELQFDTYCIRTLLVRKDLKQKSVVHVQYLEWPDFGCPEGTRHILSFCKEVRDRIELEKGLMIVHCSAGVGRTGTLISLDILLQTLKKKKEISIFETVMELRRQRTHMVQTEKQYVYIHTCIKDALENTRLYLTDDVKKMLENTYENTTDYKQGSTSKIKQHESIF